MKDEWHFIMCYNGLEEQGEPKAFMLPLQFTRPIYSQRISEIASSFLRYLQGKLTLQAGLDIAST